MDEKPHCLQFKFPIPKKSIHIPRFSINRIGRRSTVATITRTPKILVIMMPIFEETHKAALKKFSCHVTASNQLCNLLLTQEDPQ